VAVDTCIEQARTRVRTEREAVDAKLDAYEAFVRRVRELRPEQTPSSASGITAAGGATHPSVESSDSDRCRAVRTAFAETVHPHSVADTDGTEPPLDTIREEFTDAVAVALAPTTDASFGPGLKQAVLTEARSRRAEATALRKALGREGTQLDAAGTAVEEITAWVVDANETPLTDLGFDALRGRHEALASHRDRCGELARDRQAFLGATTNDGGDAGVRHRSLTPYLYRDLPVEHPVLATVARLDETCRDCQRAVRDHLVRRA